LRVVVNEGPIFLAKLQAHKLTGPGLLLCGLGVPQPSGTVVPLAEVVLALAEHPQPLHVRRLHELILHCRLLDDGDVAPDGEAVVFDAHSSRSLQLMNRWKPLLLDAPLK